MEKNVYDIITEIIIENKYILEEDKMNEKSKSEIELIKEEENYQEFNYQLLGRLKMDCDYYLGCGGRHKKHLWALDEREQIKKMKELYNSFSYSKKPEWLSYENILEYERLMTETKKPH